MAETHPHTMNEGAMPEIDSGMRRWYVSCRCCLSDAHPDVVAVLDAERDANREAPAGPGMCEVAEATMPNASAEHEQKKEEVATMAKILDPVCDMIVDIDTQRASGLTSELLGKTYAFCGPGCKRAFDKDPGKFTAKVSAWEASGSPGEHSHGGHGH
jgi:YHS domain-containing protein